jgi:hypothetical protein
MGTVPAVMVAALLGASGLVAAQPDYFPLQPGNQWVYRASRGDGFTVEVVEARTVADRTYYVARGLASSDVWLREGDDGTVWAYDSNTGQEKVWAAFSTPDGQRYATSIDPCNPTAVIRSHAFKADVALGHYDSLLAIDYPAAQCADAGLTGELYLAYIGLVQRTRTTIAGPVVYDLIYAHLGGTEVAAPELSFTLGLDRSVYPAGGQAVARLTLRNTAAGAVTLTFPSGQRYDVAIRDSRNVEVYRWSAGKAFTMIFGAMDVAGEKSWTAPFPLAGQDGKPLPAGNYVVEGWLATEPPAYRAQAPIEIK